MIVKLPPKTPVDLYDATGVTVGTQLRVTLVNESDVKLYSTASTPTSSDDFYPLINAGEIATNENGDLGAWALSYSTAVVNVEEAI